jgi:tRNA dimethylallyltransferase
MIPVIAVVGPTSTGKTRLAVDIALKYNGEVVSCDSMQIYKGMDIGTAKPTQQETLCVPHHLIDIIQPNESFSVADYTVLAKKAIEDIHSRGKLPIVAGGTGLYFNSLINNIQFGETHTDYNLREQLKLVAEEQGGQALIDILNEFDPETAVKLHPNNTYRIIRAIEVYKTSGVTMSEHQRLSREKPSSYNACIIGLFYSERSKLYDKINKRVDIMIQSGLVQEVKHLLGSGISSNTTSLQAIGYKELIKYLNGEESLEQAAEVIKQETRRYAKRQLTWFRRDKRINWIDICEYNSDEKISKKTYEIIDKCFFL